MQIYDYIKKENEEKEQLLSSLASELAACIDKFGQEKDENGNDKAGKVDFSFDLSKGKIQSAEVNTWFAFDVPDNGELKKLIKAMYAEELNEEDSAAVVEFTENVCLKALNENIDTIRAGVRRAVMPDSGEFEIPLKDIHIPNIELVDYSAVPDESKHMLKIAKNPEADVNAQSVLEKLVKISQEEESKLTLIEIAEREIKNKSSFMAGVERVILGDKYLWDCTVPMFVDYSLSDDFISAQNSPKR